MPKAAREVIEAADNALIFSVASRWKIVIKRRLGREDFQAQYRRHCGGNCSTMATANLDCTPQRPKLVEIIEGLSHAELERLLGLPISSHDI